MRSKTRRPWSVMRADGGECGMYVFPYCTGSDPTSFVLNDPDFLLVKFGFEPFLFRSPESQAATCVADLIHPMLIRIQCSRNAQPCTFGLSCARPTAKLANHACVECKFGGWSR